MKFNTKVNKNSTVRNHEGAMAYRLTPALELYAAVCTSALSDQFYEKAKDKVARIQELISVNDPVFVAKLAVYAREKMYLRSMPLVLAIELAKIHSGDQLVSTLIDRIVQRADEITELLAYYQVANTRTNFKKLGKLSKQIQKGLAKAFNKFDEYQFTKYNRTAEVKLKDALFLVHPAPKDEAQQLLFNKIAKDDLQVPYTWEVELSKTGQKGFTNSEDKKIAFQKTWEEMLDSGKIGYMALLRNLRNMLESEVSETRIQAVCKRLADAKAVRNSKQLPFRFLAAYRELKSVNSVYTSQVLEALERAVISSAANIKGFKESTKVLIACDVSGSMQRNISAKSKIQNYDIGLMLGMLLQHRCNTAISGMFGDTWKVINVPRSGILANVDEFHRREGEVGYATNGYLVLKDLINKKMKIDKVMIFTDCQLWNSTSSSKESFAMLWDQYKKIHPEAKVYLFDLAGYGNTPVNVLRKDVFLIAGWSDKVFEVLDALENGETSLHEIEKIIL